MINLLEIEEELKNINKLIRDIQKELACKKCGSSRYLPISKKCLYAVYELRKIFDEYNFDAYEKETFFELAKKLNNI